MSLHPNSARLICHESVMMCLFPHSGVYIFQEDITVYFQVKSALKWEFQEIFTFQIAGLISKALKSISGLNSQFIIYFPHLKILLLIPRSKMRHMAENYSHNSKGNLLRGLRVQNAMVGTNNFLSLSCIFIPLLKNIAIRCPGLFISRSFYHY